MPVPEFEPVAEFDPTPITPALYAELRQACGGPIGSLVAGLDRMDPALGSGKLSRGRCVWTRDRHRITLTMLTGGGFMASLSREPDPACPPG